MALCINNLTINNITKLLGTKWNKIEIIHAGFCILDCLSSQTQLKLAGMLVRLEVMKFTFDVLTYFFLLYNIDLVFELHYSLIFIQFL